MLSRQRLRYVGPSVWEMWPWKGWRYFDSLGRLLEMGDNDAFCVRPRIKKAQSAWARIGRVLRSQGAAPRIAGKFFNAVVQAVLLYLSKTWCLTEGLLQELQGFQPLSAWGMAREHKPRRTEAGEWEYPATEDVLREVGLKPIRRLIQARLAHIAKWVGD